ncbi:class I SAM-dependent methyltransferase [Kitasatospora cineracea]|uniref:Methyltransferase family protein n=1 Tax=Kitasatospora cineracea TaxID=88074 RepID=A0A8G1U9Z6_9ACTN|nr:class I SAM-dependent methyltransferase [Kitasatospora cineracea]ROR35590.1 methyltransferase family protein [Kitasatospora cineracea]
MADECFTLPRLAALYDALDPERDDLLPYLALVDELGASQVLDLGCGTGVFTLLLAGRGVRVLGVDPAAASVAVARRKPGAERVRWLVGDATDLPPLGVDLVTMTANAAQEITGPDHWRATLRGVRDALRPGGHLVFESRVPARRAWESWTRAASHRVSDLPGVGTVEDWVELLDVTGPLVAFRRHYVFAADGQHLTSDSTLRFRERAEVEADLRAAGLEPLGVRDAPDRPGREYVFLARRPAEPTP